MLKAIESVAVEGGCRKITLEVQQSNTRAQSIYRKFGFSPAVYAADEAITDGGALYSVKTLS